MTNEQRGTPIPGPDAAAALAKSEHRPRLMDRVMAPRPNTTFEVRAYRLKKALAGHDLDAIKKAASDMTHDERDVVLEEIVKSEDVAKGTWNKTTRRYDGPNPGERPAQREAPKSQRIATVALGTGDVRETFRPSVGAVVNFDRDGMVLHGRILNWGKAGALVASPDGEFSVAWSSIRQGIAPFAKAEAQRRSDKRAIRAWDSILPESMSVEEKEAFFASRGLASDA